MNQKFDYDYIFGSESKGDTESERAFSCMVDFVRSQDHLSIFKEGATGHRITAGQAYAAYGIEALQEVRDYGSAILAHSELEPAQTLRLQREALGLTELDVSKRTGLKLSDIISCEDSSSRSSIATLEKISIALGLDERLIASKPGAGRDEDLAMRLKTLHQLSGINATAVSIFAEAAWVIRTQDRLQKLLSIERVLPNQFVASENYGKTDYPVWKHGYYLASKTREVLGLEPHAPVGPLRLVCEKLGIPLLRAKLPYHIAGATVASMGLRGIVVNTDGHNQNVWVQRATIAHELGHLLWDPDTRLDQVKVDNYDELDKFQRDKPDFVEARANAFAVAFLAPLEAVKEEFSKHSTAPDGLRSVMCKFGISYSAAKYHVWNAMDRLINLEELNVDDTEPTDEWIGSEEYTTSYFPLHDTSSLRKGEFAGLVAISEERRVITPDTAALYLQSSNEDYLSARGMISELYSISDATSSLHI